MEGKSKREENRATWTGKSDREPRGPLLGRLHRKDSLEPWGYLHKGERKLLTLGTCGSECYAADPEGGKNLRLPTTRKQTKNEMEALGSAQKRQGGFKVESLHEPVGRSLPSRKNQGLAEVGGKTRLSLEKEREGRGNRPACSTYGKKKRELSTKEEGPQKKNLAKGGGSKKAKKDRSVGQRREDRRGTRTG